MKGGDIQAADGEWISFPGGELEGRRPKVLCPACRDQVQRSASGQAGSFARRPLCFQCYRAELDREKALKAAGRLDTATAARFQSALPFEAVNVPRLDRLKAERIAARKAIQVGVERFTDKRRQAQIAARHALQSIAAGLETREASTVERYRILAMSAHTAELQLPESWLPFVVAR